MLEANACGLPVAAYPVTGPVDVVHEGVNGALDEDLAAACARAIGVPRESCLAHARSLNWRRVAEVLFSHLAPLAHTQQVGRPAQAGATASEQSGCGV
jgi:glycosyltransferase involved in cell wall biosynthesis